MAEDKRAKKIKSVTVEFEDEFVLAGEKRKSITFKHPTFKQTRILEAMSEKEQIPQTIRMCSGLAITDAELDEVDIYEMILMREALNSFTDGISKN